MSRHWTDALAQLSPCPEGLEWAKGYRSRQAAWDACERADWLLWYLAALNVDSKLMTLCACDCATTALPIWRKHYPEDKRPSGAIRVARAWAVGRATDAQRAAARAAAAAAARAAADAAARTSAVTAADAAAVTAAWTDAGGAVARGAASAARGAAWGAAREAAWDAAHRCMARLIRKRVPRLPRRSK